MLLVCNYGLVYVTQDIWCALYFMLYSSVKFLNLWLLVICALLQDYPYFSKMYHHISCLSAV